MALEHGARTVNELADYWAEQRPDKVAYRFEGRATTFGEVREKMEALARGLAAAGLGKGKRIAWVGKNSDWYFLLLFAAGRVGATLVPVGWRLAYPEMRFIVDDAEAEAIVATPEFLETAQKLTEEIEGVTTLFVSEGTADVPSLEEIADAAAGDEAPPPPGREDGLVQLYTSGTTGNPKGVVLTHGNFLDLGADPDVEAPDWDQWSDQDSGLNPMPVSHIAGTGYG
ncbi:MAG: AMP-binding protein, partial [Sphingomonadales bacterium]|nr:AMP-binding protein [Sphingomonadales bacterium]